jgi:hypothetical protein
MFCSECGKPAAGKFCSNCGTPLTAAATALSVAAPVSTPSAGVATVPPAPHLQLALETVLVVDWENEWRYDELIKVPEVRQTIERHTKMARTPISGEQFSKIADKILQNPLPSDKLAAFAQPIFGSFGIRTGKERSALIDAPIGRAMLRVLCSLARHGQSLRRVKQDSDGCVFDAMLPSDPMSLEGDLNVSVHRRNSRTEVTASTNITGQIYDWGKSRRCLDVFFDDLQLDPA